MSISQVSTTWLDVYRGNPDVAVTAIDTSGGIDMSRTTGQCPAFVQVSASSITATADPGNDLELRPYEDFYFEWDFGDPDGTEIFIDPRPHVGIGDFNLNNRQTAPEAVYCYREPGTYTITLTVRAKKGDGLILRRSVTEEFTATAFNASGGTYYFDSVSGNDANDGLSSGAPKQTGSALASLATTTDRAFFIKRGSSYDTQIIINSRQRWAAYGAGAKPTFTLLSASSNEFSFGKVITSGSFEDVVASGLVFVSERENYYPIQIFSSSRKVQDVYLDDCDANNETGPTGIYIWGAPKSGDQVSSGVGLYGCTANVNLTPWDGQGGGPYSYGARSWNFVVASYFEGGGGSVSGAPNILTHHLYMQCKEHGCYLLNDFGFGEGKRSCFNLNWDSAVVGVPETARWHAISYCDMSGTAYGFDFGTGSSIIDYIDSVAQDNTIHDMAIGAWFFASGHKVTIRDQNVWGITSPNTGAGPASSLSLRLYRLNWYNESDQSSGAQIAILGDTWTQPLQFVDNIIVDMRGALGTANLVCMHVSTHLANGSLIDRNQYFAPNDTGLILGTATHGSVTVNFANWQAAGADPNGSYGDPGWTDPANGDFS